MLRRSARLGASTDITKKKVAHTTVMRENGVLDWEVSKKKTAFLVAIKTHFNAVLIVGPAHLPANSLRGGYDDDDAGDEKSPYRESGTSRIFARDATFSFQNPPATLPTCHCQTGWRPQ
jgi:hypothetical protein